jgi:hypothetical protein
VKAAIAARLTGDATLMALLTGGVHHTAIEISRKGTPSAFVDREIQPCCLIKQTTSAPFGPHHASERLYFQLYFYQRAAYDIIEPARKRCYVLLHRQCVSPTDGTTMWEMEHANDNLDQEDETLEAALIVSRYVAYINREEGV